MITRELTGAVWMPSGDPLAAATVVARPARKSGVCSDSTALITGPSTFTVTAGAIDAGQTIAAPCNCWWTIYDANGDIIGQFFGGVPSDSAAAISLQEIAQEEVTVGALALTEGSDITLLSSVEADDDYLLTVTAGALSLTALDLSAYLEIGDEITQLAAPAGTGDGQYVLQSTGEVLSLASMDLSAYLPLDGSSAMTGDLDLGGNDLTNFGQILAPNGSLAVPSLAFSAETGLGFYRLSTARIGMAYNSTLAADFDLDAAGSRFTFYGGELQARGLSSDGDVSFSAMTGGSWMTRVVAPGITEMREIGTDNVILGKVPNDNSTHTGTACFVALTQDGADYGWLATSSSQTVQITPGNRVASGNNYHKIQGSNVIIGALAGCAGSLAVGLGRNLIMGSGATGSVCMGYASGTSFGYVFGAGREVNYARANSANFGGGQTNSSYRIDALNMNTGGNPLELMIDSTVYATMTLGGIADFAIPVGVPGYATGSLPTPGAGEYAIAFDTTLGKHVGWDGSAWNALY